MPDKGESENFVRIAVRYAAGNALSGNGMADSKGRDRRRSGADDIGASHKLSQLHDNLFYQSVFNIRFFYMYDGSSQDTGKDLSSLYPVFDGSLYGISNMCLRIANGVRIQSWQVKERQFEALIWRLV